MSKWIPPFGGMTGRIKGDTPLNPRFKGVSPLWTPQNGERPVFLAGVIRTLESAAPFNFVPFNYVQGKQDKPFSGRGRKTWKVDSGFRRNDG